jgi:riboflavin kinase/FMN adenylyltransferase
MIEETNKYAATVGFFDGVHAGHRFLIQELVSISQKKNLKSMVITFNSHPRKVLHDDFQPKLLTTSQEKKELLKSTGVDEIVFLDFDLPMSRLSAREFIHQILAEKLHVALLLTGHDHRFGHNRTDGFEEYVSFGNEAGIQVMKASRFSTPEFSHISSSEIRNAIQAGDFIKANKLLSYPYTFSGYVIKGFQVGRKIGFPTANLRVTGNDKLLPESGVYAVSVEWKGVSYPAMMNIGNRPTLNNGSAHSIEVHIFDFSENIYHHHLKIRFIQKIRDEIKFCSVDDLISQLKKDKIIVEELFR